MELTIVLDIDLLFLFGLKMFCYLLKIAIGRDSNQIKLSTNTGALPFLMAQKILGIGNENRLENMIGFKSVVY